MKLMYKLLILFLSFTFYVSIAALSPQKKTHHFVIKHYDLEDGLPQISVYTIAQTDNGFIWVGTQDGVARFDGKNFVSVNYSSRIRANSDDIAKIIPHGNDVFNIFTKNGIHQLTKNKITYDIYGKKFKSTHVNYAFEASDSSVWFGDFTNGAFNVKGDKITHITKDNGLASGRVMAFTENSKNTYIGTTSGISMYHNKSGSITPFTVNNKPFKKSINSLLYDSTETLWIGTRTGLFTYKNNILKKQVDASLTDTAVIMDIFEDSKGAIWIGTKNGLFRYVDNSYSKIILEDEKSKTNIITIFEDREGSLWVGSYSGLFLIQDGAFITYNSIDGLSSEIIWSITSDSPGTIWVGSDSGLDRFNPETERYEKFNLTPAGIKNPSPTIFSLIVDNPQNMWFGTWTGGVYHIKNNKAIQYNTKNHLPVNLVASIFRDSKENIWIGTFGKGLFRLKDGTFTHFFKDKGFVGKAVIHMAEDLKGRIWAGTYAGGLNMIENDTVTGFTTSEGLPANGVQSIYFDKEGNGWIGTNSGGLALYRDNTLKAAPWSLDIFNRNTYTILEDDKRNLWISSNNGIYYLNKDELIDYIDGKKDTVTRRAFGVEDGLKLRECNGGNQDSGFKDADGNLYFATSGGLVVVDPTKLNHSDFTSEVFIEDIIADGKKIAPEKSISFEPGLKKISFQFTAPSFYKVKNLTFHYRLLGFDKNWNTTKNERKATYTNLHFGTYSFEIYAVNGHGLKSETVKKISISIPPYFYQTFWFKMLVALAIISLFFMIYWIRVQNLKAQRKKLEKIVSQRTAELKEKNVLLEKKGQELREMALKDPLTDLRNRRYFYEVIDSNLKAYAERMSYITKNMDNRDTTNKKFGLMIFDIDHFKQVNDTLGHNAGDMILKQFSKLIKDSLRKDDDIIRWGGEEFLVILKNVDFVNMKKLSAKIKKAIEEMPFIYNEEGNHIHKTCSIGFTMFPFFKQSPKLLTFDQTVAIADLGLYYSKEHGRNLAIGIEDGGHLPDPANLEEIMKSIEIGKDKNIWDFHVVR